MLVVGLVIADRLTARLARMCQEWHISTMITNVYRSALKATTATSQQAPACPAIPDAAHVPQVVTILVQHVKKTTPISIISSSMAQQSVPIHVQMAHMLIPLALNV